jgi:hypothetical protein
MFFIPKEPVVLRADNPKIGMKFDLDMGEFLIGISHDFKEANEFDDDDEDNDHVAANVSGVRAETFAFPIGRNLRSTTGYCHPFISPDFILCYGNRAREASLLVNRGDYVGLLREIMGVLTRYEPSSPHCTIDKFDRAIRHEGMLAGLTSGEISRAIHTPRARALLNKGEYSADRPVLFGETAYATDEIHRLARVGESNCYLNGAHPYAYFCLFKTPEDSQFQIRRIPLRHAYAPEPSYKRRGANNVPGHCGYEVDPRWPYVGKAFTVLGNNADTFMPHIWGGNFSSLVLKGGRSGHIPPGVFDLYGDGFIELEQDQNLDALANIRRELVIAFNELNSSGNLKTHRVVIDLTPPRWGGGPRVDNYKVHKSIHEEQALIAIVHADGRFEVRTKSGTPYLVPKPHSLGFFHVPKHHRVPGGFSGYGTGSVGGVYEILIFGNQVISRRVEPELYRPEHYPNFKVQPLTTLTAEEESKLSENVWPSAKAHRGIDYSTMVADSVGDKLDVVEVGRSADGMTYKIKVAHWSNE